MCFKIHDILQKKYVLSNLALFFKQHGWTNRRVIPVALLVVLPLFSQWIAIYKY